jgi:drug/metabolite transporter (DMT)-like permease
MRDRTIGTLWVLASAVCFALATVGAKYATSGGGASALHVTMARFVIGLLIMVPTVVRSPWLLKPKSTLWVYLRAFSNIAAVFLFFLGIQYTSVSKANLLNMTYPVFVFVLSPFVTRENAKLATVLLLGVTMVGVWNVVRPPELSSFADIALGDLLAFGSALFAGFAIAALRRARTTDASATIVFYLMAFGTVINLAVVLALPVPEPRYLLIAAAAGLSGALGQVALTVGFAHVSAQTGSLVSTSRILIAVVLGVILFGDVITVRTAVGAVLIVGSLVATSFVGRDAHLPTRETRRR